ncbi:MAG: ABC transporter permease [Halanaerobiales bacterium]|nr:ABC transporter permease [Halanaerobiales bacterium]
MTKNNLEIKTDKQKINKRVKSTGKWRDFKNSCKDFWNEFSTVKYGIVGVIFFVIFISLIIFEPFIVPFKDASSRWRDISYWEDNPKNAAPAWTNWFTSKNKAVQEVLDNPDINVTDKSKMKVVDATFTYNYNYDVPPIDILFRAQGSGSIALTIGLERPDGEEIRLVKKSMKSNGVKDIKLSLGKEAIAKAFDFAAKYDTPENKSKVSKNTIKSIDILFAKAEEGIFRDQQPLKGDYKIKVSAVVIGKDASFENSSLIVSGRVFGILGTDNSKRDLWSGVIAGTKWAMLIGLLTASVSVIIGVFYGVTSAYFGGWVDSVMMRFYEIFASIPLLPVLIVMSAIFKPSIWTIILIMSCFFWVGSVRTVRSIGLQIKEETYVEAAHALDASNARIIFKHMVPQLVPYAFASMALSVPGTIVFEATISLLGLGDATIVTWGQILHDAMAGGAVLQGIWWWVVPPGLFIALMGCTFAFIGFAMDTILNPKLRTR